MATVSRISSRQALLICLVLVSFAVWPGQAQCDTVILKDGTIYRGTVDKDNTLVFISDSLKRTIFYNSKIAKIESDSRFQNLERFQLIQPLEVHAGVMPPAAVDVYKRQSLALATSGTRAIASRTSPTRVFQTGRSASPRCV